MMMRKSTFVASASCAFQLLQQQQMETGTFPKFRSFLFFIHQHFTTSTASTTNISPSSITNGGFCSNYNNLHSVADAVASFNQLLGIRPLPPVVVFNKLLGSLVKKKHFPLQTNGFVKYQT
jgi:hypothetical protein